MSWHCAYCGNNCNGLIYALDIGGGIPIKICCHLSCLAKTLGENTDTIKEELNNTEKENIQREK